MKLIRRIFNPFSLINPNDFRKTQFRKLSSRTSLIVNGSHSRKYVSKNMGSSKVSLQAISESSRKFLSKTKNHKEWAFMHYFCKQKGKVLSDAFIMQLRIYK